MSKLAKIAGAATVAVALFMGISVAGQNSADAIIHEMIGAACNADFVGEIVPPGQTREGQSLVRALQATGVIESIVFSPTQVTVTFDLDRPNSKYMSAGFNLTIPNGFGPGVNLTLIPLPVPDPDFPAHAHCKNPDLD